MAFSQTIFLHAFWWMKNILFLFEFHWRLFLRVGLSDNKPALVQVMAWRRRGDKPLPERCWPSSLTHICGTMRRWINHLITQLITVSLSICCFYWCLYYQLLLLFWCYFLEYGKRVGFIWCHLCFMVAWHGVTFIIDSIIYCTYMTQHDFAGALHTRLAFVKKNVWIS